MTGWTAEARRRALLAVFGAALEVGLLRADGTEEDDASYRRQVVALVPEGESEMVSGDEVRFEAYARDGAQPVTGWALFDDDGAELVREALESGQETPREGFRPYFAAGSLVVRLEG